MSDFELDDDKGTGDVASPDEGDDADTSPELNLLDDQDIL